MCQNSDSPQNVVYVSDSSQNVVYVKYGEALDYFHLRSHISGVLLSV
jgi:hypothetical protein